MGACLWIALSRAVLNRSNSRLFLSEVIWVSDTSQYLVFVFYRILSLLLTSLLTSLKGTICLLVWNPPKNTPSLPETISKNLTFAGSKRSWIILFKYWKLLFLPSTFLQATSMSNKFAITLQTNFCSFSTFLILAPTMPSKLQGIVQRLWYIFIQRPTCSSFLEKLPHSLWQFLKFWIASFFARFKTIMDNVKPHLPISRRGSSSFSSRDSAKFLRKRRFTFGPSEATCKIFDWSRSLIPARNVCKTSSAVDLPMNSDPRYRVAT